MANYAASVLAKGQAVVEAKYGSYEQRRQMPTVMELALKNQKISIPDAQALRVSPLRTVDVNYLNNIAAGSATAKVAAHTGTYGDSSVINVVYVTHVETFSLPRKLAYNNIYGYQELFNNLYEMKWKNLRTRHDNSALAFLIANRCQLSAATINAATASANAGNWSDANLALEIDSANKAMLVQYLKSFMLARYFSGPYDIIPDLQLSRLIEFYMQQGSGNYSNTSFQFSEAGITPTQQIISSAYAQGAALIMPQGTLAGLVWNEGLNKAGVNAGENSVGNLGTVNDPLSGIGFNVDGSGKPAFSGAVADISMYTARADTSANGTGGSTQDIVDQWELTLTIGYVAPPLSTSNDSVIHLAGLLS
jgi:hypothetical protein